MWGGIELWKGWCVLVGEALFWLPGMVGWVDGRWVGEIGIVIEGGWEGRWYRLMGRVVEEVKEYGDDFMGVAGNSPDRTFLANTLVFIARTMLPVY